MFGIFNNNDELHEACKEDDVETVRKLLKKGVDIDLPNRNGQTPLMVACIANSVRCVKLLLSYSNQSKIDLKDIEGNTAIMLAVINGNKESANLLLNANANINIKNKQGKAVQQLLEEYKRKEEVRAEASRVQAAENLKQAKLDQAKQALVELDKLVGLQNVKLEVKAFIDTALNNLKRKQQHLPELPLTLHMVFTGNPGTGKTTVARVIGKILYAYGYLSKGHLVETDRSALVAGYVGQTAIKTTGIIKSALGGVLFIDEAYTLSAGTRGSNDFGQEAIDTLLKLMEDNRNDLMVIVAGYPNEMKTFIESNPGLKSRFNTYIKFEDYSNDELIVLLESLIKQYAFTLSSDAKELLQQSFTYLRSDKSFANGRTVRNMFEELCKISSSNPYRLSVIDESMVRKWMEKNNIKLQTKEINPSIAKEAIAELIQLTGLQNVKSEIKSFIDTALNNLKRKQQNLPELPLALHMVFTGNPGTGKTTVARIVGKILYAYGYLSSGHLVETDRSALVAGYVGQTAIKTTEVIKSALGGVLFIDEAYTLSAGTRGSNDFGQEAIDILLKLMEDNRNDLMVIVAGYPNEMKTFIESNPGLKSRFNTYIKFEDYSNDELIILLESLIKKYAFKLSDGAKELLQQSFTYLRSDKSFANGRTVRNMFEELYKISSSGSTGSTLITEKDVRKWMEKNNINLPSHSSSLISLNSLIGIPEAKEYVHSVVNMAKLNLVRRQNGQKELPVNMNAIFVGNHGIGKRSIAKLTTESLHQIGYLESDSFIEINPITIGSSLQLFASKLNDLSSRNRDCLLYISDAYKLFAKLGSNDAINLLFECASNSQQHFIVVFACNNDEYASLMSMQLSNRQHFNYHVNFIDLSNDELVNLFKKMLREYDLSLDIQAEIILIGVVSYMKLANKSFNNFISLKDIFDFVVNSIALRAQTSRINLSTVIKEDFNGCLS